MGGIIGDTTNTGGYLSNSYAKGSVKCDVTTKDNKFSYIGGIVANASNMEIDNCYSLVETEEAKENNSDRMYKGGIAGCVGFNISITHCYKKTGYYVYERKTEPNSITLNYNEDLPTNMQTFTNKLNTRALIQNYSIWTCDSSVNGGYPVIVDGPYFLRDASSEVNVYANGFPVLIDEDKDGNTVVYWDKDNENEKNDIVQSLGKTENAVFNSTTKVNVYGGALNCDINGSSNIVVKGGNVNNIYGGGKAEDAQEVGVDISAKVISGTTIDIQGGNISNIDANGYGRSAEKVVTDGDKIINISGKPVIGTSEDSNGIYLDSFTDKKVIVNNELFDNKRIKITTLNREHDTIVATLEDENYASPLPFYINGLEENKGLYKDSLNIKIVETFDAKIAEGSVGVKGNNVVEVGSGFGTNSVPKGYLWIGKVSTLPYFVLPSDVTVKIGGIVATKDTDYTYNKSSGEITVSAGKTTGDIEVSAKAVYVPPITYIDKPTISNDKFNYNGNPQCPNIDKNNAYIVNIYSETNVGEYTATISLKDKQTTKWKDGSTDDIEYKWSINKVDLHITAKDNSIIYGDKPTEAGVKYDGFVNNENESVLDGNLQYTYDYKIYDSIGNYSIMPKGYKSDNYNIIYKAGTLKVQPKKLSFKWPSITEFKYDGKAKDIKASIIGIVNKDDVFISSYSNNKSTKIGNYTAKIKAISGKDSSNYTLENAESLSCKWSIIKNNEEEQKNDADKKDNEEEKDSNKDSNKDNTNDTNKNTTESSNKVGNSSNKPINPSPIDFIGDSDLILKESIEGVKNDNGDIIVKLNDGTIISANGAFDDQIRLMVRVIKKTRKEWSWIKNITKKYGKSTIAYDIFFADSTGKRVNASGNTKISIISREKNQNIEVYYLNSDGESVKLKSKKEKYTVKFNMKENGYYSLVINDKNISINDELDNNDNIEHNNDVNESNNDKNENLQNDSGGEKSDSEEEKDNSLLDGNKNDEKSESVASKKSSEKNSNVIIKEDKDSNSISWIYIIISILIILAIILVYFYKKKKDI